MALTKTPANPIQLTPLWENFWVFAVYGILLGLFACLMSAMDAELKKMQDLFTEPLSFYSFSCLSMAGVILLSVANCTFAPTAEEMHRSCLVRNIFVPIANVGLSSGAIIIGMMFGLAVGLLPSSSQADVWRLQRLLLAMSAYVLAVIVPLTMLKRSMFDLTKEDERKSTIVGVLYCIVLSITIWQIDHQIFWRFVLTVGAYAAIAIFLIHHFSKNKRKTPNTPTPTTKPQ